jgi:Fur family transcriptional regulator, peroxide stress response regulator
MLVNEATLFREVCLPGIIAVTYQRQVLYEVHGHPSQERVDAQVKKRVPAISLATVYKNIRLFLDSGRLPQSEHASWPASGGHEG